MRRRLCGRRRLRSGSESAVTLVEVMIAVLILAVVAVGAVAFFLNGRTAIENSACRRVAAQLAKERLERSRNAGYDALADDSNAVVFDGTTYTWTLEVTSALADPADSLSGYRIVDITVDWPGSQDEPVFVRTAISQ